MNNQTAQLAISALIDKYQNLDPNDPLSETDVVAQFITPLFRDVLGFPVDDPNRWKYERLGASGKYPDITAVLDNGERIYIEAKRFGVIQQLREGRSGISAVLKPTQLSLPGLATDRTKEEQQAINYAFESNATWAILTNFERLRLFNARRDWLVLSFEEPFALRDNLDELMLLAYPNIAQGSLNALSNQRWTRDIDTEYLQLIETYRLRLAQDILRNRDLNAWAWDSSGQIRLRLLRDVVQRFLDRLVVVRFAEDHYVVPHRPLAQFNELVRSNEYTFDLIDFLQQFFRKFDLRHNSTLFAYHPVDEASFSAKVLSELLDDLYRVRYRSMSADILGNTYEQYLGKALALNNGSVTSRDNLETRKKQGTYYTAQALVSYLVDATLGRYLYGTQNGKPDGPPADGETRKTAQDIRDLRVIDPACGSGSFLIQAYYVLASFYEDEITRIKDAIQARKGELARQGLTPLDIDTDTQIVVYKADIERLEGYPRLILETHLYGVDLDAQAAELAAVNLMMRALERKSRDQRLPLILNQNVKQGNGLVGALPNDADLAAESATLAQLRQLRIELRDTPHTETRHSDILEELEELMRQVYDKLNARYAGQFTDLERVQPFHWGVEFPEVFYDEHGQEAAQSGFTIVLGNPPWEIVKPDLREFYAQFDPSLENPRTRRPYIEQRVEELNAEDPRRAREYESITLAIRELTQYTQRSEDFKHQGPSDTATHKLFLERVWTLLAENGNLGFIIPSGIYTDLGTKPLRQLLLNHSEILFLNGLANVNAVFPDVHRSFKFTLLGVRKGKASNSFPVLFLLSPAAWAELPNRDPAESVRLVLNDPRRIFWMTKEAVERFAPESLSIMEFRSEGDYQIAEKIYDGHLLLDKSDPSSWNVKFSRELDMTNDRDLFYTSDAADRVPLYQGAMIHQFQPHFAEPQLWVQVAATAIRVQNKTGTAYLDYRLAFRDIARSTDERTLIVSMLPRRVFAGNKAPVIRVSSDAPSFDPIPIMLYLLGTMNSFVIDYIMRLKISVSMNFFYLYTAPIPRIPDTHPAFAPIVTRAAYLTCHDPSGSPYLDFAPLWQQISTTMPMPAFSQSWQAIRDELDGWVARLYGLTRSEYAHILHTFPLAVPDEDAVNRLLDAFDHTPQL